MDAFTIRSGPSVAGRRGALDTTEGAESLPSV
jgi:hypothetical protein